MICTIQRIESRAGELGDILDITFDDTFYDLSRNNFAPRKLEMLNFLFNKHDGAVYLKRVSHAKCLTLHQQCNEKASGTRSLIRSYINVGSKYGSNGNYDGIDGFSTLQIENKTRKNTLFFSTRMLLAKMFLARLVF